MFWRLSSTVLLFDGTLHVQKVVCARMRCSAQGTVGWGQEPDAASNIARWRAPRAAKYAAPLASEVSPAACARWSTFSSRNRIVLMVVATGVVQHRGFSWSVPLIPTVAVGVDDLVAFGIEFAYPTSDERNAL